MIHLFAPALFFSGLGNDMSRFRRSLLAGFQTFLPLDSRDTFTRRGG